MLTPFVHWICIFIALTFACSAIAHSPAEKPARGKGSGGQANAQIDSLVQAARNKSAKLTDAQRAESRQLSAGAFTSFQQGDFTTARKAFERALAADPADAVAHYYLAEALVHLSQTAPAREHYEMANALAPDSVEGLRAGKAVAGLDRLRRANEAQALQERRQAEARAAAPSRFIVGDAVVRDTTTGLEWTQSDNGSDASWHSARDYCAAKPGGWSLPTAVELSMLIDRTETLWTDCGTESVKCRLPQSFSLTSSAFWSIDANERTGAVIALTNGGLLGMAPVDNGTSKRALCVRRHSTATARDAGRAR
jgi:Tetratricopeptide repeat/Protein of unknown function (DUF1566)